MSDGAHSKVVQLNEATQDVSRLVAELRDRLAAERSEVNRLRWDKRRLETELSRRDGYNPDVTPESSEPDRPETPADRPELYYNVDPLTEDQRRAHLCRFGRHGRFTYVSYEVVSDLLRRWELTLQAAEERVEELEEKRNYYQAAFEEEREVCGERGARVQELQSRLLHVHQRRQEVEYERDEWKRLAWAYEVAYQARSTRYTKVCELREEPEDRDHEKSENEIIPHEREEDWSDRVPHPNTMMGKHRKEST